MDVGQCTRLKISHAVPMCHLLLGTLQMESVRHRDTEAGARLAARLNSKSNHEIETLANAILEGSPVPYDKIAALDVLNQCAVSTPGPFPKGILKNITQKYYCTTQAGLCAWRKALTNYNYIFCLRI